MQLMSCKRNGGAPVVLGMRLSTLTKSARALLLRRLVYTVPNEARPWQDLSLARGQNEH